MDYPQASQYLVEMIAKQRQASADNWDPEFRQYTNGFIDGLTMQYSDMTTTDIRNDVMARAEAARWEAMPWPTWEHVFHVEGRRTDIEQVRQLARTNGYRYFLWNDCVYEATGGFRILNLYTDKEEARWTREDVK